jgi:hypothetical protein
MLGTFGDSYADPNSQSGDQPWMDLLGNRLNLEVENHGRSGTSVWYSYEKFVQNYKRYSHIVFTYSNYERINHLPESYAGYHYIKPVDRSMASNPKELMLHNIVSTYYRFLYNENLQQFLYQKIYEDVENLCSQEGIQVVHNFAFEPCRFENKLYIKLKNTKNVLGSDVISLTETETYKPGATTTNDFGVPDRRVCHFSQSNNEILADIMLNLFQSKIKTVYLNKEDFNFDLNELEKYFYK